MKSIISIIAAMLLLNGCIGKLLPDVILDCEDPHADTFASDLKRCKEYANYDTRFYNRIPGGDAVTRARNYAYHDALNYCMWFYFNHPVMGYPNKCNDK